MKLRLNSSYTFRSTTINYSCECEIEEKFSFVCAKAEDLDPEIESIIAHSPKVEISYPLVSQVMREFFSLGEENCIELLKENEE